MISKNLLLLLLFTVAVEGLQTFDLQLRFVGVLPGDYETQVDDVDTGIVERDRFPVLTAEPISAFFGLDDTLSRMAAVVLGCGRTDVDPTVDGMPVVMSLPVVTASLQPEDFTIVGVSGVRRTPQCATLQPAVSPGELRTVLLMGQLGGIDDPPVSLMITGEVLALDGSTFAGSVAVTPLADGPSLVLAEQMAVVDAACSTNTSIRVTWNGGVHPDPPAQSYQVLIGDGRTLNAESLTDLGDNDNHHVLCVSSNPDDLLVAVTLPAGLVQDPNNDEFNLAQNISVTHPPVADYRKQFTYSALADISSVSVGRESSPTQCDGCMCSCTVELSGGLVTATIVPSGNSDCTQNPNTATEPESPASLSSASKVSLATKCTIVMLTMIVMIQLD